MGCASPPSVTLATLTWSVGLWCHRLKATVWSGGLALCPGQACLAVSTQQFAGLQLCCLQLAKTALLDKKWLSCILQATFTNRLVLSFLHLNQTSRSNIYVSILLRRKFICSRVTHTSSLCSHRTFIDYYLLVPWINSSHTPIDASLKDGNPFCTLFANMKRKVTNSTRMYEFNCTTFHFYPPYCTINISQPPLIDISIENSLCFSFTSFYIWLN